MGRQIGVIYDEGDTSKTLVALLRLLTERYGADGVVRLARQADPRREIDRCDLVLVAIGASWLTSATTITHRWLDDPASPTRRAIVRALRRRMILIPLLLDGAHMPFPAQLPRPLRRVISAQAIAVRGGELLAADVAQLSTAIAAHRRRRPAVPALFGLCGLALVLTLIALAGMVTQRVDAGLWVIAALVFYGAGIIALFYAVLLRRWPWVLVLLAASSISVAIAVLNRMPGAPLLALYVACASVPLVFSLVGPRMPNYMPVPRRLVWRVYLRRQRARRNAPNQATLTDVQPATPPAVLPSTVPAPPGTAPLSYPYPASAPVPYPYPPQYLAPASPTAFPYPTLPPTQPGAYPYPLYPLYPLPPVPPAVFTPQLSAAPAPARVATPRTNRVFLSYRRGDSADICALLQHELAAMLGPANVFRDIDTIAPGTSFTAALVAALSQSDVMLVLIGPDWATEADVSGAPKLGQRSDFVRIEVETALGRRIRVIPVLIHGARLPPPARVPDSLRSLLRRPALVIHDGERRAADVAAVAASAARRPRPALSHPAIVWTSLIAVGALALALPVHAVIFPSPPRIGASELLLPWLGLLVVSGLCGLWGARQAFRLAFQLGAWPWSLALSCALAAALLAMTLIAFQPLLAVTGWLLAQAVVLIFGWRGPRAPLKLPV